MDPVTAAAVIGGVGGLAGGLWGNKASGDEAAKNRAFQRRMYKHRYQFTVEDMRKAGLNPALAYQQGGGGAPSGSMASQDDPLGPGLEAAGRGVSSALAVQQARANIAQTHAQTKLTNTQTMQLEKESPGRAGWWQGRPGEQAQHVGLMGHQASIASATANFLEETFGTRVAIAGLQRDELKLILNQLQQDIELAGLTRAGLEAQERFARSWFGQNVAPALGSAQGVSGIISGLLTPFLKYLNTGKEAQGGREGKGYIPRKRRY